MLKIRNLQQKLLSDHWTKLTAVSYQQQEKDGHWSNQKRETYHNPDGVGVLPYDCQRKTVLFVRQFRVPPYLVNGTESVLEACAGHIEKGETAEQSILREAGEELGYQIRHLELVFNGFTSPGFSTEQLWLFLAQYCQQDHLSSGGGLVEEGENLEIIEMDFDEAVSLLDKKQINDMKTALLINALRLRLMA